MSLTVRASDEAGPSAWVRVSRGPVEAFVAVAAFAVLCAVVLSSAARLVEPDDYTYRASIVAITQDSGPLGGLGHQHGGSPQVPAGLLDGSRPAAGAGPR